MYNDILIKFGISLIIYTIAFGIGYSLGYYQGKKK